MEFVDNLVVGRAVCGPSGGSYEDSAVAAGRATRKNVKRGKWQIQ